ncbi:uncharacterized protein LACBIDRAFT_303102 [Laccaria bicolor S238N-H82]|uniref:Predicted protein n=1 Tax=Laccaria bicolor (strain S238N-H82 / ATCC MYA-4686) TaxID=486041 RepID=B0DIY0_LACBS|nr:uncharacterized protein LACBIDRAFT_303102 [Laccaria bicolor S238N-H82]EDR05422.1 predicted protein [Laccaria bicolor S238N-H82]|eukprot:XP_001883980.1 predicted protein [Laccaria bicolor S238N-H82]
MTTGSFLSVRSRVAAGSLRTMCAIYLANAGPIPVPTTSCSDGRPTAFSSSTPVNGSTPNQLLSGQPPAKNVTRSSSFSFTPPVNDPASTNLPQKFPAEKHAASG